MEEFLITEEKVDLSVLNNVISMKEVPEYETNPFTKDFKYNERIYYSKVDGATVQLGTEEIDNEKLKPLNLVFAEKLYKDSESFVKFFDNNDLDYINMKDSTFKFLFYIINKKLNVNMDFITINVGIVNKELNMSLPTIYSSIIDLVRNRVIVKKDSINYWVNPHIIFKGSRKKIRNRKR